jgi:flagellar hook-basal body complex protein FliE
MNIQGVSGALSNAASVADKAKTDDQSFRNILSDAISNAAETDAANALDTAALLSDEDTEIHTSMIMAQKSELALNLAIQIRNKVVDAYNEIMRMSV